MTIVEKLKATLAKLGIKAYYGSMDDLNDWFDKVDWDTDCVVAYIQAITSAGLTNDNGEYKERINALVAFVTQADTDPLSEQNERKIDLCKRKTIEWLISLNPSNRQPMRLVSVGQTNRVYDEFDECVTGFALSVDIEEVQGLSECDY